MRIVSEGETALKDEIKTPRQKAVETKEERSTPSGIPLKAFYSPADIAHLDYMRDLGMPGQYPYIRGIHESMYLGKLWTMRMFSGFGAAAQTNKRFRFLLEEGETGLSVAFDMPTIMGYDSDHPRARGEVGLCGVAIDSLEDMEILFRDVALDRATTSMTINAPASILLAMYLVLAEKRGVPFDKLRGTIQNDILKEYIAQKSFIFPPGPSVRLTTDIIAYCLRYVPKWNPISVSGYHIREAGATAVQELAFTFADGFTYVEAAMDAGLDVDEFAPRVSFFFNSHSDFFEEIAKFRAARSVVKGNETRSGTSFVRLWKESNLIIHTWPEKCGGFISVDIYFCKAYDPETVLKEFDSFFNPATRQWKVV
ncbi:MAG: methylmalonyl-CoA mutase family protein [Planctomycetota bacterium]|jgi:methylmalonyl-CoA mutase N-terminal domain/subunit